MKTYLGVVVVAVGSLSIGCEVVGESILNEANAGATANRSSTGGAGSGGTAGDTTAGGGTAGHASNETPTAGGGNEISAGGAGNQTTTGGGGSQTETGGVGNTGGENILEGGAAGNGGDVGTGQCDVTLTDAQEVFNVACPETYCEAVAWATGCDFNGIAVQLRTATFGPGWGLGGPQGIAMGNALTIDWGTHSKTCVYGPDGTNHIDIPLVSVLAEDDVATFCDGTSVSVVSGVSMKPTPLDFHEVGACSAGGEFSPAEGSSISGEASELCYDFLDNSCHPCCPEPEPDCTGQPDGLFAGCAPRVASNYCTCECYEEQWGCAC